MKNQFCGNDGAFLQPLSRNNRDSATAAYGAEKYPLSTSREWDNESGLQYNRERYYNPYIGRFTRRDPIGYVGGINLYSYVQNNAVNKIDSSGEQPPPEYERLPKYEPQIPVHEDEQCKPGPEIALVLTPRCNKADFTKDITRDGLRKWAEKYCVWATDEAIRKNKLENMECPSLICPDYTEGGCDPNDLTIERPCFEIIESVTCYPTIGKKEVTRETLKGKLLSEIPSLFEADKTLQFAIAGSHFKPPRTEAICCKLTGIRAIMDVKSCRYGQ